MAEKLSITLPEDMVSLIKQRVASGSHASTSEVLRDAMRSWIRDEEKHTALMAALDEGEASGESSVALADVISEAKASFRAS